MDGRSGSTGIDLDVRKGLVTGGQGQLGRAFSARPGWIAFSRKELDITDPAGVLSVLERERPSVVVNAAAYTRVDDAEADPQTAHLINALGAAFVARAAEAVGALLVQISTDYVYPGDKTGAYLEDDRTGPLSVYGKTKLEGEAAAAGECSRLLIVRTSWVFGQGRNFIRSIEKAAGQQGAELPVVADQVGLPTYAPHLAEGIEMLAGRSAGGIFHLAGGGEPGSWADVAEEALSALGSDAKIHRIATAEYSKTRPGPYAPRPANSVLDCSKAAGLGVVLPAWRAAVREYLSD